MKTTTSKMNRWVALCVALLTASTGVRAELYCEGKVQRVLIYGNGDLMILTDHRGDWTTICNVETARAGVSTNTCKSWQASLNIALTADKMVTIYYSDAALKSCGTLPTYGAAPAPGYVSVVK